MILLLFFSGWKWLSTADCGAAEPVQPHPGSRRVAIMQRALGEAVPGLGLNSPPVLKKEMVSRAVFDLFYYLTGTDPRDLCTVLNFELGAGSLVSLPVLSPPPPSSFSGKQQENESHYLSLPPALNWENTRRGGEKPVILIYHTHITESFLPSSRVLYTENMDLTVCHLGGRLAGILEEQYGFTVIHHRQVYDLPRRYAYEKARPAIESLLKEQGQVSLVLDIHRDGVARASTTAELGGETVGKILFVIGSGHKEYERNLEFTLHLQQELESLIPGLSRGVRQQEFVYNQDLHPYSTLVEIGGHENSMEEALGAVPYLAEAVARAYLAIFEMEE
ncbi:MAG: stage II sporulation protein P [Firmicutes bacterium]|nr:stage II sporulation protein P [Bacillota bacterium]